MSQSLLINPTALEAGLEADFVARIRANDVQRDAFMQFVKTGLPHRRMEGWRWSDFRNAAQKAPQTGVIEKLPLRRFDELDAFEIRLTDDGFSFDDKQKGIDLVIGPSRRVPAALSDHPIAALNAAMCENALTINVLHGATPPRPILLRDQRNAASSFAQMRIEVGGGARAVLIQSMESASALHSLMVDIELEAGAALDQFSLTDFDGACHGLTHVALNERSNFNAVSLSTGGRLSRLETHLTYAGVDAQAHINSAALLAGEAHADFTTLVRHDAPRCVTRQIHKGVARDRGRAIYQGKFLVNRAAQKTDAQMTANALLLSENAEANHKPELEIYADDVECAHGSTSGTLNEEALFYMRQRGLDEASARALLIEAFVGEAFDPIEEVRIAEIFRRHVANWLERVT